MERGHGPVEMSPRLTFFILDRSRTSSRNEQWRGGERRRSARSTRRSRRRSSSTGPSGRMTPDRWSLARHRKPARPGVSTRARRSLRTHVMIIDGCGTTKVPHKGLVLSGSLLRLQSVAPFETGHAEDWCLPRLHTRACTYAHTPTQTYTTHNTKYNKHNCSEVPEHRQQC